MYFVKGLGGERQVCTRGANGLRQGERLGARAGTPRRATARRREGRFAKHQIACDLAVERGIGHLQASSGAACVQSPRAQQRKASFAFVACSGIALGFPENRFDLLVAPRGRLRRRQNRAELMLDASAEGFHFEGQRPGLEAFVGRSEHRPQVRKFSRDAGHRASLANARTALQFKHALVHSGGERANDGGKFGVVAGLGCGIANRQRAEQQIQALPFVQRPGRRGLRCLMDIRGAGVAGRRQARERHEGANAEDPRHECDSPITRQALPHRASPRRYRGPTDKVGLRVP